MQPTSRLRELDFLRGIAIILVIFRHQLLFDFLKTMGWIGVDLFFVLSGFLVSGLLFKEYQRFGSINPKLFLIRRGFKIYPIYYLTSLIYLFSNILFHKVIDGAKIFNDFIFIQNYTSGWGYLYPASWSLAVEEHFYFGLVLLLWLYFNKKLLTFETEPKGFSNFEKLISVILIVVLGLRFVSNIYFPDELARNITMTHLRIDSLLFGVLIAYWYYFKQQKLISFYKNHQSKLLMVAFSMILFTPFIELSHSFFIKTIGFTLLFVSFGIILIHFLIDKNVNKQINRLFSATIVNFVSKIGFCSYSIYVIHAYIIMWVDMIQIQNRFIAFVIAFSVSVLVGFIMTYGIEKTILNYRNKYFPNRAL